jgi:hypothetical protein
MFSPPASTVPYQPAANTATLTGPTPHPGLPNASDWAVTPTDSPPSPTFTYTCPKGYSPALAGWEARINLAQNLKFFQQTGVDMTSQADVLAAQMWFTLNVLVPFWLPIKPAA